MNDFTTPTTYPHLVPDAAPQETVAPSIAAETIAAPVKAKPKAKRKKRKAAPRVKKADPIKLAASKQANETPLTDPVPQSVQPLSEEGAAGPTPAAPLHLRARHIIPATQVSMVYALAGGERATIAIAATSVLAVTTFGAVAAWFWW